MRAGITRIKFINTSAADFSTYQHISILKPIESILD